MRYFLKLAYNGANYHGWQSQPNAESVQECIEKALSMVLREPIAITGAGRTDAGVNAAVMYAHFDVNEPLKDTTTLVMRLNSILGKDIAIYDVLPVHDDAHARFDATARTYKYFVHTEKSPFLYPFSWKSTCKLDFDLMNEAAELLKGYTDFTSFSKLHTDVATNNCKITHARWEQEGGQWVFTITADRFLRNMVRAIVGTLVDVGRGKLTIEQFCQVIEKKDRCSAGTSMPGNALFLWKVEYPYID
ncbi:MAG: tRNA pseudouridine(38-40) synthase TruA [Muribaculaceae bacterium]|jgi:tRNA pseudouridine38-40 synthase|nr:tRNA pseudouridine(38-40) synthase TruA [Muribaculaceae bacterium]MEE1338055.1 tRNA pseudouridine(38-40) synthase TruA [Muribaculaceae bacterium]